MERVFLIQDNASCVFLSSCVSCARSSRERIHQKYKTKQSHIKQGHAMIRDSNNTIHALSSSLLLEQREYKESVT